MSRISLGAENQGLFLKKHLALSKLFKNYVWLKLNTHKKGKGKRFKSSSPSPTSCCRLRKNGSQRCNNSAYPGTV